MTIAPHLRRSIRLQGFDYCSAGAHFVTICVKDRECLFGNIVDDQMRCNELGCTVQAAWDDLPKHYAGISLDAFVVMPNHVHGILVIEEGGAMCVSHGKSETKSTEGSPDDGGGESGDWGMRDEMGGGSVNGAGLKPAPTPVQSIALIPHRADPNVAMGASAIGSVVVNPRSKTATVGAGFKPAPTIIPAPTTTPVPSGGSAAKRHGLPEIVRAFKTFSARRCNAVRRTPGVALWQRNYYEHIIRNEASLQRIRQYIIDNPLRWAFDHENPSRELSATPDQEPQQ